MSDKHALERIFLEGSILRAQVKLEQGDHAENIMMWLHDRLDAWIETMLGSDQPNFVQHELDALRADQRSGMSEPRNPHRQSKHGINLDAYNAWDQGFAAALGALRAALKPKQGPESDRSGSYNEGYADCLDDCLAAVEAVQREAEAGKPGHPPAGRQGSRPQPARGQPSN